MLIKKGQALVTFDDIETNETVIDSQSRGQLLIVRGHPLRIFRYKDGDLNVPEPPPLAPLAVPNPDSIIMSI